MCIYIRKIFACTVFSAVLVFSMSGCNCGDDSPICDDVTCESLGVSCGMHENPCGNILDCGTCSEGYDCIDGECVIDCEPDTCGSLDAECGTHPDGCGEMIECGDCQDGYECEGGICVMECDPDTCDSLGYECGSHPDGCGSEIHCGRCSEGYRCENGICEEAPCSPDTCDDLGFNCGYHPDGCGGTLDCGTCPQHHECENGICVCIPRTCEDLNRECGQWNDGCGGNVTCGPCAEDEECRFDGRCISACVPETCESLNAECGNINDGCGNVVDCGSCPEGQICGGDGPNRCGDIECVPSTCESLGFDCGSHSDGCGNIITCGPCAANERCSSEFQCVETGAGDGTPCTDDDECAGDYCISEDEYGWRLGYCTGPCQSDSDCSQGSICSSFQLCLAECSTDTDCRSEGYMCIDDVDGRGICWPGATGSGEVGDACEGYWDCGGREHGACIDTWPNGYCTIFCGDDEGACSAGSECFDLPDDYSLCFATCEDHSNCRNNEGYICDDLGAGPAICVPGCLSDDDCEEPTPRCDTQTYECVQCLADADCPGSGTCSNGVCTTSPGACDIEGFTQADEAAIYTITPNNGPVLAYIADNAHNPPLDRLSIEWWFDYGATFTGAGTYPIETNSNLTNCGLCVYILKADAGGTVTNLYFAVSGEIEITEVSGDGQPFAGTLHNLVFAEWSDNDDALPGGESWCIDGYTWSTPLDGELPVGGECTSDTDCTNPDKPICNTGTQVCVECTENAHCASDERCSGNICVDAGDCDIEGFTQVADEAVYAVTPNDGPVLAYIADTAHNLPLDRLNIEWWFDYGAAFTGVGTYPIETNSNLSNCGLCVYIQKADAGANVTQFFYAVDGEIEITEVSGDGQPFAGTLHNLVFAEWSDNDSPLPGGESWCIDGYTWNTILDGDLPLTAQCTSDADCTDPDRPVCNTATGICVECISDDDCENDEVCRNNACLSVGVGDGEPGDECIENGDCGGVDAFCYPENMSGWEGGYCLQGSCNTDDDCISGVCVENICYADCGNDVDCRQGYGCLPQIDVCYPYSDGSGEPGSSCVNHRDCTGGFAGICQNESGTGWADGYCLEQCQTSNDCTSGLCFDRICWQDCSLDPDSCRTGYACTNLPDGAGSICYPFSDGTGTAGAPCSNHMDCTGGMEGICWTDAQGYPEGHCSAYCIDNTHCEGDGICVSAAFWGDYGRCLKPCQEDGDCNRSDYFCLSVDETTGVCWPDYDSEEPAEEIILEESLRDGSLPDGWTATEITWETAADGYAKFTTIDSMLQTPVLDLSDYSIVTIEFNVAKWGPGDDGPLTVEISDDGGTTWTAQEFDSPVPTDANYILSGPTLITASGDEVSIRFVRTDSPSQKRLRDVIIRGSP